LQASNTTKKIEIEMAPRNASMLPFLVFLLSSSSLATSSHTQEDFLRCLSLYFEDPVAISKVVYTSNNSSYSSVLHFSIRNLRFNSSTLKPLVIVTPTDLSHIQATIHCSRRHNLQIRMRSGGHDFEGLSYRSVLPFVVVDLINLRTITVDATNRTAWVQAGATLGELYYRIVEKSRTLAFPAGSCPTVGVGGHFSGGGYGLLLRKYGLAADNIVDAQLIDAKGRILDRESMGDDLFWAIRGGGGNSFGVVVAWKINLVEVPSTVTVFTVVRNLEQNATKLIHQWQYVANKLPEDFFLAAVIRRVNSSQGGNTAVQAIFVSLFLGKVDQLLLWMHGSFPDLGIVRDDCIEMSWIESILYVYGFPRNTSLDVLLDRSSQSLINFKVKSDYVKEPMAEIVLKELWERFSDENMEVSAMSFIPYGGKMNKISESSIPFPHRAGNLYKIIHTVAWSEETASERHLAWIRRLYGYMTSYVSQKPREAYINYRDLDIGMNNPVGSTSYGQASIWGRKYFKNNFDKLVRVKTEVDPANFFRNEQSIPPLSPW